MRRGHNDAIREAVPVRLVVVVAKISDVSRAGNSVSVVPGYRCLVGYIYRDGCGRACVEIVADPGKPKNLARNTQWLACTRAEDSSARNRMTACREMVV
jgi:hypothetical protein